jgi:hypothetical protein
MRPSYFVLGTPCATLKISRHRFLASSPFFDLRAANSARRLLTLVADEPIGVEHPHHKGNEGCRK